MEIQACTKHYGKKTALRCPSLTLEPGRFYAAVGANGSGKSTFAKLLSGTIPADGGAPVTEHGVSVRYMPQRSYAFRMSVKANLLMAGNNARRAQELMEALQIDSLAKRRADTLSGGETAKMALARVLMQPCELLILDEPTAAMDMESAAASERLIENYRQETGCTVLMITHDLAQARRTADRAIYFHRGELWEAGDAKTVLFSPNRDETGRFLEFYSGPASGS